MTVPVVLESPKPTIPWLAIYSLLYIMHIDIHDSAQLDLDALWEKNPEAAAIVAVTLETLEADPQAIDKLTTRGDVDIGAARSNIKSWSTAGRSRNLWRLRILDTPATIYRIVYGYHWQTRQLCALAVVNKDEFDYDNHDSEIVKRIFRDWAATCS
jgi:mRNA-degrading endonuclease RelE of RelBE toxin-antitoxin system